MRENHSAFHRVWFRPRILVDVENIDLSTVMLGTKVDIPFYVTATALGKLGHPEGEVILTKAAKKHNVIQMIPTLASCSFDELIDARQGDQVQWLQLYVCPSIYLAPAIMVASELLNFLGCLNDPR
jgi:L-lactate dehydrogenase (cytochrome)